MTITEFSNQFDVLYNNITSNQAPGLNEYEKSVFLTKAQNEIVKNYFTANSKGNNIGQGFDDSAKRQADFSGLMMTSICGSGSAGEGEDVKVYYYAEGSSKIYSLKTGLSFTQGGESVEVSVGTHAVSNSAFITPIGGTPIIVHGLSAREGVSGVLKVEEVSAGSKIDYRSKLFAFPSDVFIVINESLKITVGLTNYLLQIIPLRYDEYTRLMSKPYKRPLKNQAWRLINNGSESSKSVEIITPPGVENNISNYTIRYVRKPLPIIVGNLDGLTIDNCYLNGTTSVSGATPIDGGCELDPILHEDILQRAVELAKVAWTATGNDNAQMVLQAGQRSE